MAAILGVFMADKLLPRNAWLRHFVDNKPALQSIVKGSSKQGDLNGLVGALWYACAGRLQSYWGQYVRSKANLADGPSREEYTLVRQLGAQRVEFEFDRLRQAADEWWSYPLQDTLV